MSWWRVGRPQSSFRLHCSLSDFATVQSLVSGTVPQQNMRVKPSLDDSGGRVYWTCQALKTSSLAFSSVRFRFESGPSHLVVRCVILASLGFLLTGCGGSTPSVVPHSLTLSWIPSTSRPSGYFIYRATRSEGHYVLLSLAPPGATQYTDTSVETGSAYSYYVTAFELPNVDGVPTHTMSPPSSEISVTIPTP
jgi:hypothetical protein